MTTMEILIQLGGILLLLITSIFLLQGKGALLIAGYNTLSAIDKAKYDKVALCKAVGKLVLCITVSIVLIFMGEFFQLNWLLIVGTSLMIAIIIAGLIYLNTGNRYRIHHDEK